MLIVKISLLNASYFHIRHKSQLINNLFRSGDFDYLLTRFNTKNNQFIKLLNDEGDHAPLNMKRRDGSCTIVKNKKPRYVRADERGIWKMDTPIP
jgi:hypothetical protein